MKADLPCSRCRRANRAEASRRQRSGLGQLPPGPGGVAADDRVVGHGRWRRRHRAEGGMLIPGGRARPRLGHGQRDRPPGRGARERRRTTWSPRNCSRTRPREATRADGSAAARLLVRVLDRGGGGGNTPISPALDPDASREVWGWLYEGCITTRRARSTWTIRPVLSLPLGHPGRASTAQPASASSSPLQGLQQTLLLNTVPS